MDEEHRHLTSSRSTSGKAAPGRREKGLQSTHSDEAGQEVREYIVAHDARSQDQLLGLVVAGQLKGRGGDEGVETTLTDCQRRLGAKWPREGHY